MDNHYHLLIETKYVNLSKFMHNLNSSYTVREVPCYKKIMMLDKDKVIEVIAKHFKIKKMEIFSNKRDNIPKKVAIYTLRMRTDMKIGEIGKIFSLSYSAVSKSYGRFKKELERNKKLRRIVDEIYAYVKT